jgi:predicted lipid carrier protein YhbT
MNQLIENQSLPKIPPLLSFPIGFIPSIIPNSVLVTLLNKIFANALADEELDFLHQRVLLIRVLDANLSFRLTLIGNKLVACNHCEHHDLLIEGSSYDFLLLASRREDADTLFFNRRLRLGGNTELGLYVKNFLDAQEVDEQLLKPLEKTSLLFDKFWQLRSKLPIKSQIF